MRQMHFLGVFILVATIGGLCRADSCEEALQALIEKVITAQNYSIQESQIQSTLWPYLAKQAKEVAWNTVGIARDNAAMSCQIKGMHAVLKKFKQ